MDIPNIPDAEGIDACHLAEVDNETPLLERMVERLEVILRARRTDERGDDRRLILIIEQSFSSGQPTILLWESYPIAC